MTEPQEVYFVGYCHDCGKELYSGMDFNITTDNLFYCADCAESYLTIEREENESIY